MSSTQTPSCAHQLSRGLAATNCANLASEAMNDLRSTRTVQRFQRSSVDEASRLGRLVGGAVIAVVFMGSTLLTPLYDLYRSAYGLSVLGLGLLYAVYVIGNLIALLFLGRLS